MNKRITNIFIIDDSPDDLDFYTRVLEANSKYKVFAFTSIEEFNKSYNELHPVPDCILIDYNMPKQNGINTLQSIKTKFKFVKVPLVILTGDTSQNIKVVAAKNGAHDLFIKDLFIDYGSLDLAIQNIINRVGSL